MSGSGPSSTAGGRSVTVAPQRLAGWLARFAERHGEVAWTADAQTVVLTAADGARAECTVSFPPLSADPSLLYGGLLESACSSRRVGVLLVRLGGYAVGVFDGERLVASKVGSRQVHGRSAAGGWSQRRFARRREAQARVALDAAADTAARILVPAAPDLDAVVTGGDRRALAAVLDDRRLAPLRSLLVTRTLDVPDPRQRVLESTPALFRAVHIRVFDPPATG